MSETAALDLWTALAGGTPARRERAYRRLCVLVRRAEEDQRQRKRARALLDGKEGTRWARERRTLDAAMEDGGGIVRLLALLRRHLAPGVGDPSPSGDPSPAAQHDRAVRRRRAGT